MPMLILFFGDMNTDSGEAEADGVANIDKSERKKAITILFADDDDRLRQVLAMHLESRGYHVLTAADGDVALRVATREIPELAILDIVMPKMNGWEVARRLRGNPRTAEIRLLMLSGIGVDVLGANLEILGGDMGLDKPFEMDDLDEAIRLLLGLGSDELGKTPS